MKPNTQSGYAIIAALWLSGLALGVAAEFTLQTRSSVMLTASRLRVAELSMASSGVVRLWAFRLAAGKVAALDGKVQHCKWNENTTIAVSVQDNGGLLDANVSSEQMLADVLEGLAINKSVATSIAAELVDYRDADTVTTRGANEPRLRNGRESKNAPLETVEELDLLPSMTDEMYWRIKPFFTTFSGQAAVDPEIMPLELNEAFNRLPNAQSYFARSQRRSFRIAATAMHSSGTSNTLIADIILLQQPNQPFQIVSWNQGKEAVGSKVAPTSPLPCFN